MRPVLAVIGVAAAAALIGVETARLEADSGTELLARAVAVYPDLTSYSDTGTVVRESPGLVDRWKFTTRFRRESLDFYFDFQGVDSRSTLTMDTSFQQIVLWMVDGELQSFNKQLKLHEHIPRAGGNQPAALQGAVAYTVGTSTLIPGLIFAKANLNSTIRQIREVDIAGVEAINGRRCHKLVGQAAEYYPSGAVTNRRQVSVWIDAETQLVRQVFEDTPEGYPPGVYSKVTITIEPQANPALERPQFQFDVPR